MPKDFQIVGVLNVTPDSYFDGGKWNEVAQAVKRAGEMIEEGADIIEVGGESSGPGSKDVSLEEEINRTIDIIKSIKQEYPDALISIDTYKSEVAARAIESGVVMINDVTAGRGDPKMFEVLSESDVKLVLMFSKDDSARTTIDEIQYDDVIADIISFLQERIEEAKASGIDQSRIIIDPGMGHFVSSDSQYSFQIIRELERFKEIGLPIFISPSRKSFLAGPENLPPSERLPGTIVSSAIAAKNGATYIRTHDVAPVRRGCDTVTHLAQQVQVLLP